MLQACHVQEEGRNNESCCRDRQSEERTPPVVRREKKERRLDRENECAVVTLGLIDLETAYVFNAVGLRFLDFICLLQNAKTEEKEN